MYCGLIFVFILTVWVENVMRSATQISTKFPVVHPCLVFSWGNLDPKYFYELFIANPSFLIPDIWFCNINTGRHLISVLAFRDNTNTAQLVQTTSKHLIQRKQLKL